MPTTKTTVTMVVMMSNRITSLPGTVRESLPEDLQDATMYGTDVAAADESVRIYGGPGTGKTTQIAFRIASVHHSDMVKPSEMTVVTYRRSLADTTKQRLTDEWAVTPEEPDLSSQSDPENPYRFWSTMHAVASRATGFVNNIDESQSDVAGMADDEAKRAFCEDVGISHTTPKGWQDSAWDVFHSLYTYSKSNLLDVGEWSNVDNEQLTEMRGDRRAFKLLQEFRSKWSVEFEKVVNVWEAWKREHGVHDFYEQLEAALNGSLPPMKLLVVDEYHDVYPLMALVAERWIESADTSIVAGDPDQVVNSYAGADPRFFEQLDDRLSKDLPVVTLPRSYRVPDEHYAVAKRVLAKERRVPDLETAGPGQIILYSNVSFVKENGAWVTPEASETGSPYKLWKMYGTGIMYLARMQFEVDSIGAALDEHGVVYQSQDGVAGNWSWRLSVMRALRDVQIVEGQQSYLDDVGAEVGESKIIDPADVYVPDSVDVDKLDAYALLKHTDKRYLSSDHSKIQQAIYDDDTVFDLTEHVTRKWWSRYGAGRRSIQSLTYTSDRDETSMRQAWTRYSDQDRWTVDSLYGGTRLLTIHASKGAEAEDVIVFDGISRRIRRGMKDSAGARENEARTWYVALTRASKRLHMVRNAFDRTQSYLPDGLESAAAKAAAAAADKQGESA